MTRYAIWAGGMFQGVFKAESATEAARALDNYTGSEEAGEYWLEHDQGFWGDCTVYEVPRGYTNRFLDSLDADADFTKQWPRCGIVKSRSQWEIDEERKYEEMFADEESAS